MILFGNASDSGRDSRGWFVGSFIEAPPNLRHTNAVEIKWMTHAPGEARADWGTSRGTSMTVLLRGRLRMIFQDREHVLETPGDYVMWAPGVPHRWVAIDESLMLTVRWPS
jgi:quercetin dioxygenase-like cupin family protein